MLPRPNEFQRGTLDGAIGAGEGRRYQANSPRGVRERQAAPGRHANWSRDRVLDDV